MIFFIMIEELEAVKEGWSDVDLVDIDKDTTPEGIILTIISIIDFAALDEAIKEFDGDLPANELVSYFSIFLYR